MSGGDYESGIVATYVIDGCVAAGCHTLVMEDVGGDGMCGFDMGNDGVCDFGGTMSLTNAQGDVLAGFDVANSNFGALATWEVCATGSTTDGCDDTNGNGICDADEIAGCSDANACNFMTEALIDDGSCSYPAESHLDCEGNCLTDTDQDGVCDALEVAGCMEMGANNYDPNATDDDNSCTFDSFGCMDADACNYNPVATVDDGMCEFSEAHLDCLGACLDDVDGDGICDEFEIPGCMDPVACNYDSSATDNNGSCTFAPDFYDCEGICLSDSDNDGVCDELEVGGCDIADACNFTPNATDNDGSCTFAEELYDCDGNCLNDADGDGICDELEDDLEDSHGFETDNVGEVTQAEHVTLFPNPMNDGDPMVYLRGLSDEHATIRVLGTDGRIAWQGPGIPTKPGVVGFPIRETVAAGSYLVQVVGTSTASTMRLMIQ
jgi:hypothetical protein